MVSTARALYRTTCPNFEPRALARLTCFYLSLVNQGESFLQWRGEESDSVKLLLSFFFELSIKYQLDACARANGHSDRASSNQVLMHAL